MAENPNATLPFCQWNLHDGGQSFSQTARLTCFYTYDFTCFQSPHVSAKKWLGQNPTSPSVFFFWTHFRLVSLWTAMHMRMRSITPSVYLLKPLRRACWTWSSKTTAKKTAFGKRATPQVIFSNKELQPIAKITSSEQECKHLATVP